MKRQVVSSNWRDDLSEYVDISNVSPKKAKTDTKSREKVEEKEVNNKVVINPPMTEAFEELGGTIISIEEEKLSKEEMEELQRKKDKEQGRKPGKVEENLETLQLRRAKKESEIAKTDMMIAKKRKADAKKGNGDQSGEMMQQVKERTMTPGEKQKDTKLKKKYDDSDMKKNMQAQYGKEEGKKVYFATIRKQAMESALNPFQYHPDKKGTDKGTPEQAKKIAKNISDNRKKGPMKYDPENDTKGT